jgi:U3 small nucleolar RNA-associated protein 15
VKVFDVKTKSALRTIKGHNSAVRVTGWANDGLSIISGSDDKKIKRWDLGTEELLWQSTKGSQHTDYVRALDVSPIHQTGFISGSYDHSVRIWDSRQADSVSTLDHGQPVDFCMISPSGALAFSAGGNEIKLWDILSGGRLMHVFNNHQKNITGLCMNDSGSKLLSCGLDGFVKVYSVESLQVAHSIKYSGPCMSVAFSPDDSKLIVGLVDGTLTIRNKTKTDNSDEEDGQPQGEGIFICLKTIMIVF